MGVDVCRKHGVCSAAFYKRKAKYDALEVSDAKRLKVLEDVNARPNKLLTEPCSTTCSRTSSH